MTDRKLALLETLGPDVATRMISRRESLWGVGRAGLGLALASVPVALGGRAKRAFAQGGLPQNIVDVLNFALTLEYLEDEFYRMGLAASGLIPAGDRAVFQTIGAHETAHVAFLEGTLGGSAVPMPTFDFTAGGMFPDVFSNYDTFKVLAQGFEDTGVRAYKGQAPNLISSDQVLTAALTIHSVEARHAAEVRRIRAQDDGVNQKPWITGAQVDVAALQPVYVGEDNVTHIGANATTVTNAPDTAVTEAFDEPLSREAVLAIAGLFIVSS